MSLSNFGGGSNDTNPSIHFFNSLLITPSAPQVASVPAADEPAVNTLPPTGASSDRAEAVEESRMEDKMFDLGDKSWEEEVAGLDEDEAKAAEAIRRMRQG